MRTQKGDISSFRAVLAAALLAVCLSVALTCAWRPLAFADDSNVVNPQQMPDSSFIYDTSIDEIASADAYLDNRTVQITGEAIGDIIKSETENGHCWVLLESSSGAAVSVYMTKESAALIDTLGAYGKVGTTLQVRGTFHLSCIEHAGLSDLHADNVSVVKKGHVETEEFNIAMFFPGVSFVILGLLLVGLFHYLRERQR